MNSSMSQLLEDIGKHSSRIKELSDICGSGRLTLAGFNNASRAQMTYHHMSQRVLPEYPERPDVFTGAEHVFGYYSEHSLREDWAMPAGEYEVVGRVNKFSFNPDISYMLLLYNKHRNEYHAVIREEVAVTSKQFGFRYNNNVMDSLRVGDTIPKGTNIRTSPAIHEDGNYQYGLNADVAYTIGTYIIEDAVEVCTNFQERATYSTVEEYPIVVNENDILLNLKGDNSIYKAFNDVGEWINSRVVVGTRKINNKFRSRLKNKALRTIDHKTDRVYKIFEKNSYIADIDLYWNSDLSLLPDTPENQQIKTYYYEAVRYHNEILSMLGRIIDDYKAGTGIPYTAELSIIYKDSLDRVDPSTKYVYNDSAFSHYMMNIKVYSSNRMGPGNKIVNRHAGKSVISKISTPEEMGMTKDGRVPDIKMNLLGIIARQNAGQIFEPAINTTSEAMTRQIRELSTVEQYVEISKFVGKFNRQQMEMFIAKCESLSPVMLQEYIDSLIMNEEGNPKPIPVKVEPVGGVDGDTMRDLMKKYKPYKEPLWFRALDGNMYPTHNSMYISRQYIVILEQIQQSKTSARNRGAINPRTFLPIKSSEYAKKLRLIADQSNNVGEQEAPVLLLGNPRALDYYLRHQSTCIEARRSPEILLTDGAFGYDTHLPEWRSVAVEMMRSLANAQTLDFGYRYTDASKEEALYEWEEDMERIPDIPDELSIRAYEWRRR